MIHAAPRSLPFVKRLAEVPSRPLFFLDKVPHGRAPYLRSFTTSTSSSSSSSSSSKTLSVSGGIDEINKLRGRYPWAMVKNQYAGALVQFPAKLDEIKRLGDALEVCVGNTNRESCLGDHGFFINRDVFSHAEVDAVFDSPENNKVFKESFTPGVLRPSTKSRFLPITLEEIHRLPPAVAAVCLRFVDEDPTISDFTVFERKMTFPSPGVSQLIPHVDSTRDVRFAKWYMPGRELSASFFCSVLTGCPTQDVVVFNHFYSEGGDVVGCADNGAGVKQGTEAMVAHDGVYIHPIKDMVRRLFGVMCFRGGV